MKDIWLLGLLILMLYSCSSVQTSVDPWTHENEWIVRSYGSGSDEATFADAKKRAAEKSNSKGMDCFVVKSDSYSPSEALRTRTMHGEFSDGSSFSYEIPSELRYSQPSAYLFVSFHKHDECKNFEITKGQDRVFYNNETIKKAKSVENKYIMLEFFVWGVIPASIIALSIYYK
jgi:hypothetical protein